MNDKREIQKQVEATLDSLDGIQRAAANPYLFTRIRSELDKEERSFWSIAISFISRPAVAIAAIVVVISVNAAVFLQSRSQTKQSAQEGEQLFATEYNLSSHTIYDATVDQQ